MTIRLNRPSLVGNELRYVEEAVRAGHTSMSGSFSARASAIIREALGAQEVILTTSCTDALEMAAMLLQLQPGDSVIVPSFTFVSTALAFARQGAELRFCDIERDTLGADPDSITKLMDDTVRAIVPVHYAGVGCDIERIVDIAASQERCEVVEDNAHGLFGSVRGQMLGSFGRFSTLSFHETKNFICGEGGALVMNDERDIDRARVLRDKGTNRSAFLAGSVDKYSWVDIGSSFGISDLLAAYLVAQLEERDHILQRRATVAAQYDEHLLSGDGAGYSLPRLGEDVRSAYHMYYVLLENRSARDAVIALMNADDIYPAFHYVPLHDSPGAQPFIAAKYSCPVTDEISDRLLRLPFFTAMTEAQVAEVSSSFLAAVKRSRGS